MPAIGMVREAGVEPAQPERPVYSGVGSPSAQLALGAIGRNRTGTSWATTRRADHYTTNAMVGLAGFEPAAHGVWNRCSTD